MRPIPLFKQAGLTLLELIVALMVFSVLSLTAYSALSSVVAAKQQSEQHAARLADLQRMFLWMTRDLEQVVARKIRDEYGQQEYAFVAPQMEYQLAFTRTGWMPNPVGPQRSQLQRVAYSLNSDNQLVRTYWSVLDRAEIEKEVDVVLLDNVQRLEFRYLDGNGEWQPQWPVNQILQPGEPELPRGVAVEIEAVPWGRISRLFVLPEKS